MNLKRLLLCGTVISGSLLAGCAVRSVGGPPPADLPYYVCTAHNHRTDQYFLGRDRLSPRLARQRALMHCRGGAFPKFCLISWRRPCFYSNNKRRRMYVCQVRNLKTNRIYFGRSPSRLRAISRARMHCQKGSFGQRCSVHTQCLWKK